MGDLLSASVCSFFNFRIFLLRLKMAMSAAIKASKKNPPDAAAAAASSPVEN